MRLRRDARTSGTGFSEQAGIGQEEEKEEGTLI
jgi:hypothetical protein